jgi:integrase
MAKKKTARTTETAPLKWQEAQTLLKCLKADGKHETRLMLALGFYTGLRISDILRLTWGDILAKKEIVLQERKTGKTRKMQVNPDLVEIIDEAAINMCPAPEYFRAQMKGVNTGLVDPAALIFTSKKGPAIGQPLTVVGANLRIKRTFEEYGIKTQNASSHCLRKTFARRVYEVNHQSEAALILLSQILNHDGPATTRRYIGLTAEVVAEAYLNL